MLENLLINARQYNQEENFKKTISLLDENTLKEQNNIELYIEKAKALWENNYLEDCKNVVNLGLSLDNNNVELNHYLGKILYSNKQIKEAEAQFKKNIELQPNYYESLIALGIIYFFYHKNYEMSLNFLNKASGIAPENHSVFYALGSYYFEIKDYDKAIENYKKSLKIKDNYYYSLVGLGTVKLNLHEFDKARSYFEKAIKEKPQLALAYTQLGNLYFRNLDFKNKNKDLLKAQEYYDKAIERNENDATAFNGLGNIQKLRGNIELAIRNYEKAIKLNPFEYSYKYNIGLTYFDVDDFEKAEPYFQDCLNCDNGEIITAAKYRLEKINNMKGYYYSRINDIISKIKKLLFFKGKTLTHYTSMSVAKLLIFKESNFRLSEGTFLNDTSEGQELYSYLNLEKVNDSVFVQKPFIGSFVAGTEKDNLNLWRMYGKEAKEEAKGCSITINLEEFRKKLYKTLPTSIVMWNSNFLHFYRVVYCKNNEFTFDRATIDEKEALNSLLGSLHKVVQEFSKSKQKLNESEIAIYILLNEIAYLFKSHQFEFESEIRIILENTDVFPIKIDENNLIPKVYLELIPILSIIEDITIGPKVEKADEWQCSFHYFFKSKNLKPEINISKLPYK